jgi:hypothetical protein
MLENGLATELHLSRWIRALLYFATSALLAVNVVLYLWYRRGHFSKGQVADHAGVYAVGVALVLLGSALILLGTVTGSCPSIPAPRRRGRALFWLALAGGLGIVGLLRAATLLFARWPH